MLSFHLLAHLIDLMSNTECSSNDWIIDILMIINCRLMQDDDRGDDQLWRELTVERVTFAVDAAQTALSIMTAPSMPKQVYLEDVIERTVMMTKTQLINTIFPEFDPVYRIDPKSKRK